MGALLRFYQVFACEVALTAIASESPSPARMSERLDVHVEETPIDRNTVAMNRLAASIEGLSEAILRSVECPGDDDAPPPDAAQPEESAASASTIPLQMTSESEVCGRAGGCCQVSLPGGRHAKPDAESTPALAIAAS